MFFFKFKGLHTVILEYFNIKNKHFLILPSSLSIYSSAPKTKKNSIPVRDS